MDEKDLVGNIVEIDKLLARVINPPLTRAEHDGVRDVMGQIMHRVKLSYQLEAEKKEAREAEKDSNGDK